MLKKLTLEGVVESGLYDLVAGKLYAYVAVLNGKAGEPPYRMGVAVANEPGYYPVPIAWCYAEEGKGMYEAMRDHARELNAELGLSIEEELKIVASSMRNTPRRGT